MVLPGMPGAWVPWLALPLAGICGATCAWYLPGSIAMIRAGSFDVVMFFVLAAAVGGVGCVVVTWRWLRWLRGGRPRLSLTGPPPCPGAVVRLEWVLDGAAADRLWILELEQEEQGPVTKVTVSQHGSMLEDKQERRSVRCLPVITLPPGQRNGACELRIPADAAPSFDLAGWAVVWQVLAVDERGRRFRFPFVIFPATDQDREGA